MGGGEVESFTLLKLTLQEASSLLLLTNENNVEQTLDGSVVIKYTGNDTVHKKWKDLASEHSKKSPVAFFDVSAKFKTNITGTSCLVRDPVKHEIKICLRKGNDNQTINRICIDNGVRQRFFNDVKVCSGFRDTGKYYMDTRDLGIYTYWSKYMNTSYINQYKEWKVSRTDVDVS